MIPLSKTAILNKVLKPLIFSIVLSIVLGFMLSSTSLVGASLAFGDDTPTVSSDVEPQTAASNGPGKKATFEVKDTKKAVKKDLASERERPSKKKKKKHPRRTWTATPLPN